MFYNQTLLKDGAFIVCEDASEYDPNVVAPNTAPVAQALVEEKGYDPVLKIYSKLKPYYIKAKSFYEMMTPPVDKREMVVNLEALSDFSSELIDKLRKCEVKLSAMSHACSHLGFELEPILNNLGMIIQNRDELTRKGLGTINVSYTTNHLIAIYRMKALTGMLDDLGFGVKKVTISIDQLATLAKWDYENQLSSYNSIQELFDSLYDDTIRIRMEQNKYQSISISNMIDMAYDASSHEMNDSTPHIGETESKHALIQFASKQLRRIKITLNNMIMNAPEMNYEEAKFMYIDIVRNTIVALLDLIYLFTIDLHTKAYMVKEMMDRRNCYDDYVRSVKSELKT